MKGCQDICIPQGAVCVSQARALEVHVHSEFTSLPMALLFFSGKGLASLFLEQGLFFLFLACRKLSLATQACLRFVSSYKLPGFVKSWRHPEVGKMSQVTSSLMAHLEDISWALANLLLTVQEPFFFPRANLPPSLVPRASSMGKETAKNMEHCHYAGWGEGNTVPTPRPTHGVCHFSSLTNAWVSLQALFACSCSWTRIARKRKFQGRRSYG